MLGSLVTGVHAGALLLPLLVVVAGAALLGLGLHRAITPARVLTVLVATTYLVGVVAVTMFPQHAPGPHPVPLRDLLNVEPLRGAGSPTFALNVVMTVPLGMLLPLLVRVRGVAGTALVGLLVSGGIEVTQGVGDVLVGLGRTVDVDDLVANVTGTVLGLVAVRVLAVLVGPGLARFALPSGALAVPRRTSTGRPQSGRPGASTATTTAASSAVPKTRSPEAAYGSR